MLKSLRNRILAFFVLLAIVTACTVFPLNYIHQIRKAKIDQAVTELNQIHTYFIKDLKFTSEFLSIETTNPVFFETGTSLSLEKHEEIKGKLFGILQKHEFSKDILSPLDIDLIRGIRHDYQIFCDNLDSIAYFVFRRGYSNMGLEGEMLSFVDQLNNYPAFRMGLIELRFQERAYLYKNDSSSAQNLVDLSRAMAQRVAHSHSYSSHQKKEIIVLLSNYRNAFLDIVNYDRRIGLKNHYGLKTEVYSAGSNLELKIEVALKAARAEVDVQRSRLNLFFALLSVLLFLSTIGLSIYLSRHLVNHLEKLTVYISQLSSNNFSHSNEKLSLRKSSLEIRAIYMEIRNMVAQIRLREKQRDAALSEVIDNESRYRELTDLLPQSIFEADKMGNLLYANKAWFGTFGYEQANLDEGLNLIEILQTNTENTLLGVDKVEHTDYVAIRKNGERFPALVYADNITADKSVIGRRGIIIDATLRNKYIQGLQRETVRAVKSDKQKSSFLANMSHEIRTPMNSIIGFANLLSAGDLPEEHKTEFVEHIQSSGKILLNLIDDIIDIAKIEAGEIKIKPTPCEPSKIIHELTQTFEGYKAGMGKAEIELIQDLPDKGLVFNTDPFRLRQIISNLTSNAIKFTEKGHVKISYRVKNHQYLEFSIEDTGVGLTQEELKQIFTRFQRTSRSEEKNISGTGLGLAISKNLVELMGGQMWVSSIPSEGTRFWFQLPYSPVYKNGRPVFPNDVSEENSVYQWHDKTILVAEDDDTSFLLLKRVLQQTQARVVRVVNGREVVEAVKFSDEIDLILMDIQMPYLDGYAATTKIKESRPQIPIIAQTAYAMDGDKEQSVLAGCDDYMTKPINPSKLLAKMNQFLVDTKELPDHPIARPQDVKSFNSSASKD